MRKLCIICCYSYLPTLSGGDENDQDFLPKRNQVFKEFCGELGADHNLVLRSLEGPCGDGVELGICSECLAYVHESVEVKGQVDNVEGTVRRMQEELLGMLRELEGLLGRYFVGMRRIRGIVRDSDVSCLQSTVGDEGRDGVFLLRSRINDVVTEMEAFRDELSQKTGGGLGLEEEAFEVEASHPVKVEQMDYCDLFPAPLPISPSSSPHIPIVTCDVEVGELSLVKVHSPLPEMDPDYFDEEMEEDFHEDDVDSNFSEDEKKLPPRKKPSRSKKNSKAKVTKSITSTISKSKKNRATDLFQNCDTASWTPFKRRFVTRLLKRSKKSPPKNNSDPSSDHSMTYDPSTDTLSIGGITILLLDASGDSLQCSACNYEIKASSITQDPSLRDHNLEKNMMSHVLGHHLDAFRCPVCSKSLLSQWRYREHLKGHQGQFSCPVCGKSCFTKGALEYHAWGHKSKEERAEALRNGAKDPKRYVDKEKISRRDRPAAGHVCSSCGKGFQNLRLLRQHEEVHLENREMVICPRCGKKMLKRSYLIYHKNQGCSVHDDLKPHRVHCTICDTSFKTRQFLNRHMRRIHSKEALERRHVCGVCSKRFKSRADLAIHSKLHAEEILWKCGRGCGKEFSVKRYWRRHELSCGGGKEMIVEMGEKETY